MNLTSLSLKWDRVAIVLLIVALLGGILSYKNIPQAEDPGFIIRIAVVQTIFPGASPERVEQLVTDKLEKVIQEIPEIDFINSESRTGFSIIYVNIKEKYKNMRPIWDTLRRKVNKAIPELPDGVYGPYVNDEFGDVYGQIVTLTGDGYSYAELKDIADDVRDEMLRLPNAAKVEIVGDQEEQIFIEFNNAKLAELKITPAQLQSLLSSRNIIIPGGSLKIGRERLALEPSGNFDSLKEMEHTVVPLPGSRNVVYLGDLVSIRRGYVDPANAIVNYNGKPSLALAISMTEGGNIIDLGADLNKLINKLQTYYPHGINFNLVANQPERVKRIVTDFQSNLIQSIIIVILVLLVSLGLRTGSLVGLLIPFTIIITILFMRIFGIGIDQISLAGMLIALGMLVDNAIVVSENIIVQVQEGKIIKDAAISAGKELAKPLLISSLITTSAFLPITLAKSNAGEYCAALAKVVGICLISSWVLALTIIPLFCVLFLKVKVTKKEENEGVYDTPFYKWYRSTLTWILRNRTIFLGSMVVLFIVVVMGLSKYVPKRFMPDSDNPIITVEIDTTYGSSIEHTTETVKKLENFINRELKVQNKGEEGVKDFISFIGEGAPRYTLPYGPEPPRANYTYMIINTTSFKILPKIVEKLRNFATENMLDAKPIIKQIPMGPPVNYQIEVRITGKDSNKLYKLANTVKTKLTKYKGIELIKDDWGEKVKKVQININQEQAFHAGISSMDVAISLQTILSGFEISQYRENDKIIPIVLRAEDSERLDVDKLRDFRVYSLTTGHSVPLEQVADVNVVFEASQFLRRDRARTITVQARLNETITADEINQTLIPWLTEQQKDWDLGYRWELGGEYENSTKANESIMVQLPIAGLIIIILLVMQFNSYRKPLVLMSVIPFGMIGVFIGLYVGNSYFGFITLLGVISLSGIIINNANVLMDRIRIEEEENGLSPDKAIIEAAQRRLRPILLTSLTTVGGLLPLWISGGPFWQPMAISIIFGLTFATTLTLAMVPTIYSIFYRVKFK